jgi:hypothetical protein
MVLDIASYWQINLNWQVAGFHKYEYGEYSNHIGKFMVSWAINGFGSLAGGNA